MLLEVARLPAYAANFTAVGACQAAALRHVSSARDP